MNRPWTEGEKKQLSASRSKRLSNKRVSQKASVKNSIRFWATTVSVVFVCSVWGVVGLAVLPLIKRVDKASIPVLDCRYWDPKAKIERSNPNCLPSAIQATTGSIREASGQLVTTLKAIQPSVQAAASNSAEASHQTVLTTQNINGLVSDTRDTMKEVKAVVIQLHSTLSNMQVDIDSLLRSSDTTMQDAGKSLEELTTLEGDLRQAIAEGSPKAMDIANAMLERVQDPNITSMLIHLNNTSSHVDSVTDTVDIVTLPLRKKVNQVRWLLEKIAGLVKLTFNPF